MTALIVSLQQNNLLNKSLALNSTVLKTNYLSFHFPLFTYHCSYGGGGGNRTRVLMDTRDSIYMRSPALISPPWSPSGRDTRSAIL